MRKYFDVIFQESKIWLTGSAGAMFILSVNIFIFPDKIKTFTLFNKVTINELVWFISVLFVLLTLLVAPYNAWKKCQKELELISNTRLDEDKAKHLEILNEYIKTISCGTMHFGNDLLYNDLKEHKQFEILSTLNDKYEQLRADKDLFLSQEYTKFEIFVKLENELSNICFVKNDIEIKNYLEFFEKHKESYPLSIEKCRMGEQGATEDCYVIKGKEINIGKVRWFTPENEKLAKSIVKYLSGWVESSDAKVLFKYRKDIDEIESKFYENKAKCIIITRLNDICSNMQQKQKT